MESQGETPYSVYFLDGEQHLGLRHVWIHPGSQFKVLQSPLSQKTGLPANQISAVLVCRKGSKPSEKHQKKLPINENTNFAAIVTHHNPRKDKSCFLLVSVRRSRRDRERRGRSRRSAADDDGSGSSRDDLSPPSNPYAHRISFPEKMILRRDPTAGGLLDLTALRRIYSPAMDGLLGAVQDNRLHFGSYGPRSLPMYAFENAYPYGYGLNTERAVRVAAVVCEICSGAREGRSMLFHPCVYDEVIKEACGPSPVGDIGVSKRLQKSPSSKAMSDSSYPSSASQTPKPWARIAWNSSSNRQSRARRITGLSMNFSCSPNVGEKGVA